MVALLGPVHTCVCNSVLFEIFNASLFPRYQSMYFFILAVFFVLSNLPVGQLNLYGSTLQCTNNACSCVVIDFYIGLTML